MKLDERIENIKPYFVTFNVSAEDDAIYVVIKVPSNWTAPDAEALKNSYSVQIVPMQGGLCFATEIKNGAEAVFDAVDYVIKFNKGVEERKELLTQKLTELKKLFVSEDLEKLKTLKFVFESEQEEPKKKKGTKKAVIEEAPASTVTAEEPEDQSNSITAEECDDTPLMAMAKNLVED